MTAPGSDLWIKGFQPNPFSRNRLFCFSCAGGSATSYRGWARGLPAEVEVLAVQLPGRGPRIAEPIRRDIHALVGEIADALLPFLDRPFAFFGHSLGALLAFETARRLRRMGAPQPAHLFLAALRAPHLPLSEPPAHDLPDADFLDRMKRLGGTPPAILEHRELIELLLPVLRGDFALNETYTFREEAPLTAPFTVFGGAGDRMVSRTALEAWGTHTSGGCEVRVFEGDHFFFYGEPQQSELFKQISMALQNMPPPGGTRVTQPAPVSLPSQ